MIDRVPRVPDVSLLGDTTPERIPKVWIPCPRTRVHRTRGHGPHGLSTNCSKTKQKQTLVSHTCPFLENLPDHRRHSADTRNVSLPPRAGLTK